LPIDNTEVTDFKIGRIGTNGIIGDFIARVLHVAILRRMGAKRPPVQDSLIHIHIVALRLPIQNPSAMI